MKNWKYIKVGNGIREAVGNRYSISVTNPFKDAHRYGEELAKNDYNKFKFSSDSELERIWRENTSGQDYEIAAFSDFKKGYNQQYMKMDRTGNSKFGNDATADKLGLRPVIEGMEKDIYEIYKKNGQNREKTKRELIEKHNFSERQAEETMRKLVGNKSIYKQEASMFKGLGKDAEKEIGNAFDFETQAVVDRKEAVKRAEEELRKAEAERNKHRGEMYWEEAYITAKKDLERAKENLERAKRQKTGNADTVSEYNAEIQRLTKKAEQLRRMGQGRSAMEIEKQIEKLGKELSELGNKKVGNAFDAGIHLTIRYNGKEEEVKVLKDMPTSVVVKGQNGSVVEIKKVDLDVLKVHNETKDERKFGKVMGEFEEGELKTPQGKTVTDPAQAKAIAYSEADKVDNLKRARNAMNKKVKNSAVREYKDREGRIAQIDFNEDGTDADMSIYEDERTTRSVESKNFSTIRDAEQYVQSHGFRRVG